MSRRRQSKKQRRKCPDFRHTNADNNGHQAKPSDPLPPTSTRKKKEPGLPSQLRNKKRIPILSEHDLPAELFGVKEEKTSFVEVIDQALADPDIQQVLQETLTNRADTDQKKSTPKPDHYPAPESELDLHGATGPEAETRAAAFITASYHKHLQSLRIITGKGLHSENGPVLPDVVEETVLKLKKEGLVRTFRWEKKEKLKSGAIIIYLS